MALSDFDRDVLKVAVDAFRAHDPSLSEEDAQPIVLTDWPQVVASNGGRRIGMLRLRWLQMIGQMPTDRGRVGGKSFWLRRDAVRWAKR